VDSEALDTSVSQSNPDGIEPEESRVRGHGRILGKLRLDRGPLRWWLIFIGLLTIDYTAWRFSLGVGLVLAGAVLHIISKGYLRPGRKFLNRTRAITTRGPYRFTRNPFYLANLFAEVGLLIIIGRLWMAVIYLPIWAWVYCKTILEEERKLLGLCGEVYERYCQQVPRLFPVPWQFLRKGELSGPRFSWSNPHIAEGYEIQRALRLVSYPFILRAIAAVVDLSSWSAAVSDPTVIVFASGFGALNAIGWVASLILRRLRRSEMCEPTHNRQAKSGSSPREPRCAA
jgi:protein-S-isoprenylcysteine O-methyltransferase Ste14